jgi:hypothetical protein
MIYHYQLPPHVKGRGTKQHGLIYTGSEYDKGYEGKGVHFNDPARDGEVIDTLYIDKDGEKQLYTAGTPKDKEIIVPDALQNIMDDIDATKAFKYMRENSRLWLSPMIPIQNLREGMVVDINIGSFTGQGIGKIVKIEPKGEDGGVRYYDITIDRMIDENWVKSMKSKWQRQQYPPNASYLEIEKILSKIDPKEKEEYVENSRFYTNEYDERKHFTPQIEFDETANSYYVTGSPLSPLDKFIRQINMKQMATENKKPFPFFKMFAVGFAIGIIPLFLDNRRDKV